MLGETKYGEIKKIVKTNGYGFIQEDKSSKVLFFHATEVVEPKFEGLLKNMKVMYIETETPKGLRALAVVQI